MSEFSLSLDSSLKACLVISDLKKWLERDSYQHPNYGHAFEWAEPVEGGCGGKDPQAIIQKYPLLHSACPNLFFSLELLGRVDFYHI